MGEGALGAAGYFSVIWGPSPQIGRVRAAASKTPQRWGDKTPPYIPGERPHLCSVSGASPARQATIAQL